MQMALICVSLTALIAIILYRYGFFGGAGAKAVMAISVILPIYNPLMSFYVHPITGITVLTNAVLFALVVPLHNALSNLVKVARGERIFEGFDDEPKWRKILACFIGTPSNKQEKRHHSVIERSLSEGKKRFSFCLNYDDVENGTGNRPSYTRSAKEGQTWLSQKSTILGIHACGISGYCAIWGCVIEGATALITNAGDHDNLTKLRIDGISIYFLLPLSFLLPSTASVHS
jgi:ABC-type cobalt transport system substrate-binding protein